MNMFGLIYIGKYKEQQVANIPYHQAATSILLVDRQPNLPCRISITSSSVRSLGPDRYET